MTDIEETFKMEVITVQDIAVVSVINLAYYCYLDSTKRKMMGACLL